MRLLPQISRPDERISDRLPGAVLVLVLLLGVTFADSWADAGERAAARPGSVTSVVHSGPPGRALAEGFVGLSFEYSALPAYTGRAADPVLVQLIRNLVPGQPPVLRIGGDSTDQTWWPVRGVARPGVVDYALTPGWLRDSAGLARALKARLILGINLAIERPALAAAEARALDAGIGRGSIAALEIGNEPDIYLHFPAYRNARGRVRHVRGRGYDFSVFMRQFSAVRRALPHVPIAGPALGGLGWGPHLGPFIAHDPGLRVVTVHLYPLFGLAAANSPGYPTVARLLSNASTTTLARGVVPYVRLVHAHRLAFRVDELNSVTSGGRRGISNTFASALWVLDTLVALDQAGVDGVNVHMFPTARYAPFSLSHAGGRWTASVHPEYYGLLMFGQAAPPGSRILPVVSTPAGPVKIWATVARDNTIRAVLINDGPSREAIRLSPPPGAAGSATAVQMLAPSLTATGGITIGGQTFGSSTTTGLLTGQQQVTTLSPALGVYPITLPPTSATLLTWKPGSQTYLARAR